MAVNRGADFNIDLEAQLEKLNPQTEVGVDLATVS